jgi:hypothetical protein
MPDWRQEIRSLIASLNLDVTRESEIVEELNQHLADRREEMLATGLNARQVDEALRKELHDPALTSRLKATVNHEKPRLSIGRDTSGGLLERCWVDLRYGARILLQNPGFAIVVIASLGLGIGANTAIFQLLNAVCLRTLPVAKPEQLAAVRIVDSPHCCRGDFYSDHPDLTGGLWNQLRQQQQGFSDIAAWHPKRQNLGRGAKLARWIR